MRKTDVTFLIIVLLLVAALLVEWLAIAGPVGRAFATAPAQEWLGFAGNLIAGAMTLIAATVAWLAVQRQIRAAAALQAAQQELADATRITAQHEAKATAIIAINHTIQAAATTNWALLTWLEAKNRTERHDSLIDLSFKQLEAALKHWRVQEASRGLSVEDRVVYFALVSHLSTCVELYNAQAVRDREQFLRNKVETLSKVPALLRPFSKELADMYDRDSVHPQDRPAATEEIKNEIPVGEKTSFSGGSPH